jgi:eukaryotic-like serine/threonine-protein kinase
MAAAMTVALGLTVIIIRQVARQASESSLAKQLDAAKSSISDQLRGRSARLRDVARAIVPVPQYLSRVNEALRQQDRANLQDQADEFRTRIGADWVLLTDAEGVLWTWTLNPQMSGEDMRGGALIGLALEGKLTEGVWIEPGDSGLTLYQAVGVPLSATGERPAGVLVAAVAVDSAFSDTLARNTGGDVVFFVEDSAGKVQPITSSRGAADALADVGQLSSVVDTTGHKHLGERWEGAVGTLTTADNTPAAGFVGLRSREAELAPYSRLERTVWLAFIVGIALILVASVFVTRRVTRPVVTLASATRRVADGDYSADITGATGDDEIGDLTRSFSQMLEDLREKKRLVEFLAAGATPSVSASRTDLPALSSSGPTNYATIDSLTGNGSTPAPGDVLGTRYEILDIVGEGGMGVVYRVRDRELDEVVALKMLRTDVAFDDTHAVERFKREIVLARRITHRNVVRTYDLGEHRGALFITMEYVEGASLAELIRDRGRLPLDVTISIGRQLCRAVEIAHEAGVIHRDIKPQNIIVQADGFVKVMDFGIARVTADRPAKTGLTQAGAMLGTPGYMPPEQLLGEELDSRADVYAMGAVLFECLTGRPPYEAPNTMALVARVLEGAVPDPRELEPDVPSGIAAAIKRALSKERGDRFATARELRTALEMSGIRLSTV